MLGLIEGLSDGAASFAKLYRACTAIGSNGESRWRPSAISSRPRQWPVSPGPRNGGTCWPGSMCGWIARGVRTPVAKCLLTEATTPATYGRAFGLERAMDSAGAVLGPLDGHGAAGDGRGQQRALSCSSGRSFPGCWPRWRSGCLVREKPHAPQPASAAVHAHRSVARRIQASICSASASRGWEIFQDAADSLGRPGLDASYGASTRPT